MRKAQDRRQSMLNWAEKIPLYGAVGDHWLTHETLGDEKLENAWRLANSL
jgi:hypothetical protein